MTSHRPLPARRKRRIKVGWVGECDYLIIGAGAAGSVLARRLTDTGRNTVVLVEAGADLQPGREPWDILNLFPFSSFNRRYMWPDTLVHWRSASDSPPAFQAQGRILGGSSALMGMYALRGNPRDYDEWSELGASGWDWASVLPYFRRLESDHDFGGPLHGDAGPIPIRREPPEAWSALARVLRDCALRRGWTDVADANADFSDGHCVLPVSRSERQRAGAGLCYLTASVRQRRNLRILPDSTASRLILRGRRVEGVEIEGRDGPVQLRGRRATILAAGALRTPELLLRSGIGSAQDLGSTGIEPVVDLPGVGRNMQNHCAVYIMALQKQSPLPPLQDHPPASTFLRWSSGQAEADQQDLALYIRAYASWHAVGRRLASMAPTLLRPHSTGQVQLRRSPGRPRLVEYKLLSDERDLLRLKGAVRLAAELLSDDVMRRYIEAPALLSSPARLSRRNDRTIVNRLISRAGSMVLDCAPFFGRRVLDHVAKMTLLSDVTADDAQLESYLKSSALGQGHVTSTCRMGPEADRMAVTDSEGRVHGIDGLYIGDASLMPRVPSANTHIPTVMVAEKIASAIDPSA